jgi:hypothetical protein
MIMLGIGVGVGLLLAVLVTLLTRAQVPRVARRAGPALDDQALAVRAMLRDRDADVLRKAGYQVPDEPHSLGQPVRPQRAGLDLDEAPEDRGQEPRQ